MTFSGPDPASAPAEQVVLRVRAHPRRLLLPVLLLLACAAAVGYWGGSLPELWMNSTLWAVAAVVVALLVVGPLLSWSTRRAVLTNRRLIIRHGVFVQHRTELSLARIREVRSRRTLMQRLFRTGNIHVLSGADAPTVLRDVPNSELVSDALQELVELNFSRAVATHEDPRPTAGVGGATTPGFAPERAARPAQPFGAVLHGSDAVHGGPAVHGDPASGGDPDDTVRISPATSEGPRSATARAGFSGGRFTRAQR